MKPGGIGAAVGQQVRQAGSDLAQGAKSEATNVVYTAGQQLGVPVPPPEETIQGGSPASETQQNERPAPVLPMMPAPFDAEAYRQQVDRETQEKLIQLRRRLAEIQAEVNRARGIRVQSEQQYSQTQDQLLQQQAREQVQAAEVEAQRAAEPPPSVRAKGGTGESKRQHKG